MSTASLVCSRCGAGIPEEDLETGSAISVLGKSFCAACKGKAVQDISLDDLMEASTQPGRPSPLASSQPAAPARTPAPKPAAAAAPTPRASPPPRRPETARLRIAQLRRRSKAPLVAGAAAALVAVAVTAFLVTRDRGPKPPAVTPNPPVTTSSTGDPPKPPADLRMEKAQVAFTSAEMSARRADLDYDQVLAGIENARPACKGTPYETKLEELRNRVLKEKDIVEGTRILNPLVDELKAAVAADPNFARYADLVPSFEKARELASRSSPQKLGEINVLQSDYSGRYEKAAEPFHAEIKEYAAAVADEKRYDLALKKIDTFPVHLRRSGAWKELEKLKQDIERRKAASK